MLNRQEVPISEETEIERASRIELMTQKRLREMYAGTAGAKADEFSNDSSVEDAVIIEEPGRQNVEFDDESVSDEDEPPAQRRETKEERAIRIKKMTQEKLAAIALQNSNEASFNRPTPIE